MGFRFRNSQRAPLILSGSELVSLLLNPCAGGCKAPVSFVAMMTLVRPFPIQSSLVPQ
jgi:hypothetical protein